ncbi:hypothetical protein ABBQ38_011043 [Trebouxia sp. C0009 RCD-2024]
MRDGTEKPCALKCTTRAERETALNELEALYMARGIPHTIGKENNRAFLEAGSLITQHILQAVVGMHQQGRGICDIKPGNVRVSMAPNDTILGGTLLDLGGAVAHDGPFCNRPSSMMYNSQLAFSRLYIMLVRAMVGSDFGRGQESQEGPCYLLSYAALDTGMLVLNKPLLCLVSFVLSLGYFHV